MALRHRSQPVRVWIFFLFGGLPSGVAEVQYQRFAESRMARLGGFCAREKTAASMTDPKRDVPSSSRGVVGEISQPKKRNS